ncbi:serpentine type 7TM GPCR chemoreceptor srt domain-containing protein [Ditylenchus destructor]|uniref:Serpentine type 7TM GPCR chemoreceptor srt domain-containing protein n=1 Tax=Ditylenchus destructor TaxID=166010 RepID=A0AAD4N4Y8_9BILA|nr:serpentine type 7TM GPCR chemoreceptor srt domain-containing protein [Ditylenchus destructor]
MSALSEILYIPCVWAIYWQIKSNSSTCYIFMFYLGIMDTIGLFLSVGWYAANTTTLILAINRCLVLYDEDIADKLFKGYRSMMWLIVPTVVGLECIWLSPPVFYNPIDLSAIFNPHRHYLPDDDYVSVCL